jgi:hypothetical protein
MIALEIITASALKRHFKPLKFDTNLHTCLRQFLSRRCLDDDQSRVLDLVVSARW